MFRSLTPLWLCAATLSFQLLAVQSSDPKHGLYQAELSNEEQTTYTQYIKDLGDADFDTRDEAKQALIARGPAVIELISAYETNDPELKRNLHAISTQMLLQYDGYLPQDPELVAQLDKPFLKRSASIGQVLTQLPMILQAQGFNVRVDPRVTEHFKDFPYIEAEVGTQNTLRSVLELASGIMDVHAVVRSDILLFTNVETALRLSRPTALV